MKVVMYKRVSMHRNSKENEGCNNQSFWFLLTAGCLLRSMPDDVLFDNATGIGLVCDLANNIAAPWPSSSSMSSMSFCAPGN